MLYMKPELNYSNNQHYRYRFNLFSLHRESIQREESTTANKTMYPIKYKKAKHHNSQINSAATLPNVHALKKKRKPKTPETGHKHNPVSQQVENNHSLIKQMKYITTYWSEDDAKLMLLTIPQNSDYCLFIRFLHRHQVIKCYPFSVSKRNCSIHVTLCR